MNAEETETLWKNGAEAWNAWALELLQRKQALEEAGDWAVDWFGEGQNPETEAWLSEAKADFNGVEFASDASFASFVFPGPALFDGAHFIGKADFSGANFANTAQFHGARLDGDANLTEVKFYDLANFDDTVFVAAVNFEKAEFLRETTGPLVPAARFQKTQFGSRIDFRTAKFVGNAEFVRARFGGNARFDEAEFQAEATFEAAFFEGTAGLVRTRFIGAAKFFQSQFLGKARLGETEFLGGASFEDAAFKDDTAFRGAKFGGDTTFQGALFDEATRFDEAQFSEDVNFRSAKFSSTAKLSSASFAKGADFHACKFSDGADFEAVVFSQTVDFPFARFKGRVSFAGSEFAGRANFLQTTFGGRTNFRNATFKGAVEFSAMQSRAPFVMSASHFVRVPDFHDASFKEPPSLDHMTIGDPVSIFLRRTDDNISEPRPRLFRAFGTCGNPEYAARYRRLRKLATETQDYDQEREFFAQELRCRRFWHDKPLGRGLARFWIGWLYGGVSDFGRSLVRPVILLGISTLAFSLVYLGLRRTEYFATATGPVAEAAAVFPAWPEHLEFGNFFAWIGSVVWWFVLSVFNLFAGGGCIAGDSGATGEALFLSLKNSFFFLGWESPDASRRVYSCLYGFENVPGVSEQLMRVPLSVSATAVLQNVIGLTLVVLFLIALRNLLRAR